MTFFGFWRSEELLEHERWQEVRRFEDALHGTWGLGGDEKGQGYRGRLKRLCEFLRDLEPEPASIPEEVSDFAKLARGLAQPQVGCGAREDYLHKLEDLRKSLEALAPADGAEGNEYLDRLKRWPPSGSLTPKGQAALERALKALGALPADPARQDQTAQSMLQSMSDRLDELEKRAPSPTVTAANDPERARCKQLLKDCANARERWRQCLEDFAGDVEWAWLQVLIRLAKECLRDQPFHSKCREHAKTAKEALEKAIPRLEKRGFNQSQAEGLYGILAATCLALAKAKETPPDQQRSQIETALVYARHAVAIEPERGSERLVLLEVLSALGDPEDIKVQAEIALDLDSGPETLRTIGESYWGRAAALRDRGVRRKLLHDAEDFFAKALNEIESAPLDEHSPRDQIEKHAWTHFWLGRFQSELGRFAAASAHLETACTLGFKPLEARIELAWTCLLARYRKHADRAFRAAIEEAERWQKQGAAVAVASGEKRPVVELAFEAHLGWAFLCADWDPDRAMANVAKAEALRLSIARPDDFEWQAALAEVRGRVELHSKKLRESLALLEESVRLSPGSGAYYALGLASLGRVRATAKGTPAALQRALEAYHLGRDCDVRGRHGRERRELRRELRKRGVLRGPRQPRKQEQQHQDPTAQPGPSVVPSASAPPGPASPAPAPAPGTSTPPPPAQPLP